MTGLDDLDPADRDRRDEVARMRDTGDGDRLRGRHPVWFERGPGLTDYHPDEVEVDDDA